MQVITHVCDPATYFIGSFAAWSSAAAIFLTVPSVAGLGICCVVILFLSIFRFRKQRLSGGQGGGENKDSCRSFLSCRRF